MQRREWADCFLMTGDGNLRGHRSLRDRPYLFALYTNKSDLIMPTFTSKVWAAHGPESDRKSIVVVLVRIVVPSAGIKLARMTTSAGFGLGSGSFQGLIRVPF